MAFVEFQWDITPERAFGDLTDAYIAAIRNGVRQIAAYYAPQIESWMKANASWTDRTGNARQTLSAEVEDVSLDMVKIVLAHGVEYGVWLEIAHAGAYSILGPAIDYWGPQIWADVQTMLR